MEQGFAKRHIRDKGYLDLLDSISSPVWLFDVDRHAVWWANRAAVRFWRSDSLEDLIARDFSTDSDMVRRRLRQVIDHTAPDDFASETWTLYPMGHPVTVMLTMSPVSIGDDPRDAVLIEVKAPIQMDDDPQGLRMLEAMRYTTLMVSSFTFSGECLSRNPAAMDCYSDTAIPRPIEGTDFIDRFVNRDEGRILLAAARAGAESAGDYQVYTRHGPRWHSVDVTLGRDPMSGEASIVVTEEDITRSHEMQRQLEDLNKTLERRVQERTRDLQRASLKADQANQAKSDFIAHMSHDLRTPLNAILGFSDIIRTGLLGDDLTRNRDYAASIHRAATQLLALINDLLDISRIESGHMLVQPRPVDLQKLVEEACELVRGSLTGSRACCRISIEGGLSGFHTDPRILHQILVNLLTNAAKYTPSEGAVNINIAPTIVAGGGSRECGLSLAVSDNGRGIPAEHLSRIFNPYERGNPELADRREGTGLGLAIVRGLVSLLGGEISVDSEVGRGTTVTVILPAMTGQPAEQNIASAC